MRRARLLAVSAALALVAVACGGHDTQEPQSAGQDSSQGGPGTSAPAEQAPTPGQFGTMAEPVCGPGDASGATAQGVTDDTIKIGTLSDPGNTVVPGLLQELFDASEAFVAWCNAAGGINGRQIELTLRDTKLVEGQQRVAEACTEDFALVGGGSGLDSTLAQPRVDCGLVDFPAFLNDPVAQAAPLKIQATNPLYPDYLTVGAHRLLAERFPDDIEHYGLLAADLRSTGTPYQERVPPVLADEFGYDAVYVGTTPAPPATVDNYRPYVEALRDAGVTLFEFRGTAEMTNPLMSTMAEVGYRPTAMILAGTNYGSILLDGNDAIDEIPTWVETTIYPFEDAANNPPTQQFLELMDETLPGWSDDPKMLGVFTWSSWLLFAQSAKECGSDLTRDCVLEKATAISDWDGGGLHAPMDPDPQTPRSPACVLLLRATSDGFEIDQDMTQPNHGPYNCDDANRVEAPR